MMINSFDIQYHALKDAPNILYLDDEAKAMTQAEFEKELETGYRAALLLIPVANAVQLQIAMMTPYHKDLYALDPGFVVENYNNYIERYGDDDNKLHVEEEEFFIGEIQHA